MTTLERKRRTSPAPRPPLDSEVMNDAQKLYNVARKMSAQEAARILAEEAGVSEQASKNGCLSATVAILAAVGAVIGLVAMFGKISLEDAQDSILELVRRAGRKDSCHVCGHEVNEHNSNGCQHRDTWREPFGLCTCLMTPEKFKAVQS